MQQEQTRMPHPYVISQDIRGLLEDWASQRGFCAPDLGFFREWRGKFTDKLKTVFGNVHSLDEEEIKEGIRERVARFSLPVISMDRAYFEGDAYYLDITRLVHPSTLEKEQFIGSRTASQRRSSSRESWEW